MTEEKHEGSWDASNANGSGASRAVAPAVAVPRSAVPSPTNGQPGRPANIELASVRAAPTPTLAAGLSPLGGTLAGHVGAHTPVPEADEEEQMRMEAQIGMLLTAASKNNIRRMRGLLNAGVPPSSADYDQRTGLHIACSEGHMEAAQLLIDEGADVNAKDRFGSTALDDAMRGQHHELVAYLLTKKSKHGGLDKLHAKLIEHCAHGDIAAVQMLLAKDADGNLVPGSACISPNCCDYDKRTPLHLAVAEGHVHIVALLLANGADPHAQDRWGLTPLAEADRKAARVGSDPIKNLFREGGFVEAEHESIFSFFSLFFGAWEIMMIILFGLFTKYSDYAAGNQKTDQAAGTPQTLSDYQNLVTSPVQHAFTHSYLMFQDVHVMIFIGFGFLMVFLRKHGYTSVGLTFLVGAFCIQWYQLCSGFWHNAFTGAWNKIPLGVEQMILGDFSAGAVLITFGVLLGKVNPSQMLFVSIIEIVCYSLNERIGLQMAVDDVGGTMTIHMLGAFFGYGCTWMMTPKEAYGHENNAANYHSDIMAMIGTVFLWMFWPSFNGAICIANAQERAVLNTYLSLAGSCTVAFIASHVFRRERKFNMVDIQNATLAGGVAMGACADLLIQPGSAIAIGAIAGLVSVLGYVYVQPFLERHLGLHDTCGVNNLHGMPSLIGGFASVIAAHTARVNGFYSQDGYGEAQLQSSYSARGPGDNDGRSADKQAAIQFAYMCTSVGIGLLGGVVAGHFATLKCFETTDVEGMYRDDAYWEVPQLETPYYFDHRGEISRDPAAQYSGVEGVEGAEGEDGAETSKVVGANLDAPDNARLLELIQTLEQRLNQLTRRVGAQLPQVNGVGSGLPSVAPITGLSAIPQQHVSKSQLPAGEADYPASKLALGNGAAPASASDVQPLLHEVAVEEPSASADRVVMHADEE